MLGVVLLGHQKRILVSLGNDRPGFDGMWRKSGNKVTDISRIVQVGDVRIDGEEDIYFKHDFSGLHSKVSLSSPTQMAHTLYSRMRPQRRSMIASSIHVTL